MMTPQDIAALEAFLGMPLQVAALIAVWSLLWKGVALWHAARLSQKGWFVVLLVVNTVGLFEIAYILYVRKKFNVTVEEETKK